MPVRAMVGIETWWTLRTYLLNITAPQIDSNVIKTTMRS